MTNPLADDWVYLGPKVLTKSDFQAKLKQNFGANNGSNPYTIEKKDMRVDLFGDTAVVTYTKEYRQTDGQSLFKRAAADTTLFPPCVRKRQPCLQPPTPTPRRPSTKRIPTCSREVPRAFS